MLLILVWQNGSTFTTLTEQIELLVCFITVPTLARLSIVILAYKAHYPRDKGTGLVTVGNIPATSLLIAIITLAPSSHLINNYSFKAAIIATLISVIYWRKKANKEFGGVTGDVLGACCETTELLVLFSFVLTL